MEVVAIEKESFLYVSLMLTDFIKQTIENLYKTHIQKV